MFKRILITVAFTLSFTSVHAVGPEVHLLQEKWAEIKYRSAKDAQAEKFESLMKLAETYVRQAPRDAEILIWYGIIESSYAGAKGGLVALGHAKNAKKTFENAIEVNPTALDGSAFTSLGSLYYQVPGWPIGFGDDKKALEFLRKGLSINSDGIDSNFFYGDFLLRSGDLVGAEAALRKALKAPSRLGRATADEGRRTEIEHLLQKLSEKRRG